MSDTQPSKPSRSDDRAPQGSPAPAPAGAAPAPTPNGAGGVGPAAGLDAAPTAPPQEAAPETGRVRVRPADRLDAAAIGDILADVGVTQVLAEPDALTRQRLRAAIGDGADADRPHAVWVAELEDRVVGFAAVNWTHNYRPDSSTTGARWTTSTTTSPIRRTSTA